MSNITTLFKPRLTITLKDPRASATVEGKIEFSDFDRNRMKDGLRYVVRCQLFGDDPQAGVANSADDLLNVAFEPARIVFTGEQPETVRYQFVASHFPKKELNEDGVLADEIYARVRLTNNNQPPADLRQISNVIEGEFA